MKIHLMYPGPLLVKRAYGTSTIKFKDVFPLRWLRDCPFLQRKKKERKKTCSHNELCSPAMSHLVNSINNLSPAASNTNLANNFSFLLLHDANSVDHSLFFLTMRIPWQFG